MNKLYPNPLLRERSIHSAVFTLTICIAVTCSGCQSLQEIYSVEKPQSTLQEPSSIKEKQLKNESLDSVSPTIPKFNPENLNELTLEESILIALENNPELQVERLQPRMNRTAEDQERSAFDPTIQTRLSGNRSVSPGGTQTDGESDSLDGELSMDMFLPTGTTIGISAIGGQSEQSGYSGGSASTRLGAEINQSLLQGFGTDVNLASLRQARLDTLTSEYELRGYSETLVSRIEKTYWEYYQAIANYDIVTQSLDVAQRQLDDTAERVRLGKTAGIELAAAKAELALRRESLIDTKSQIETLRLQLLRLLNPTKSDFWEMVITLHDTPTDATRAIGPDDSHVEHALIHRPELRQAQLRLQQQDLEIVKTKNGLLPKLDLFISLGGTGYARSFGDTWKELDGDRYDVQGGLVFQYPLGNRSAEARHRRTLFSYEQAELSIKNLEQTIQLDVRSACIEIRRTQEQIEATKATRQNQEEKLRNEMEKFNVGKSTSLLVASAQRDLMSSQMEEVRAVVSYQMALIDLYLLEGSLLDRRGITTLFVDETI